MTAAVREIVDRFFSIRTEVSIPDLKPGQRAAAAVHQVRGLGRERNRSRLTVQPWQP